MVKEYSKRSLFVKRSSSPTFPLVLPSFSPCFPLLFPYQANAGMRELRCGRMREYAGFFPAGGRGLWWPARSNCDYVFHASMLAGIYGRATSGRINFSTALFKDTRTRTHIAFSGLSSGREHFSTMVETDFYHRLPLVET